jgi:hypothetical protein
MIAVGLPEVTAMPRMSTVVSHAAAAAAAAAAADVLFAMAFAI